MRSNEQKLIDIVFSVAETVRQYKDLKNGSQEHLMEWVARQLFESGFPTVPIGSTWGILTTEEEYKQYYKTDK